MATYTFDYNIAGTVSADMAQVTKQLQDALETMHTNVMNAMQDWQDSAKDAYWVAKGQWDAAAARMPFSLNQAEVALQSISEGYLHVEHTGVNQWGGYSVH